MFRAITFHGIVAAQLHRTNLRFEGQSGSIEAGRITGHRRGRSDVLAIISDQDDVGIVLDEHDESVQDISDFCWVDN